MFNNVNLNNPKAQPNLSGYSNGSNTNNGNVSYLKNFKKSYNMNSKSNQQNNYHHMDNYE